MVAAAGFLDLSKLYGRRLLAERCLLAIARYQAKSGLEAPDGEALSRLERLLSNVQGIKAMGGTEALVADAEGVGEIVGVALEAENRHTTLPQLLDYIQQLQQTALAIREGKKAKNTNIRKLNDFVEVLATTVTENISHVMQRKTLISMPVRHA